MDGEMEIDQTSKKKKKKGKQEEELKLIFQEI